MNVTIDLDEELHVNGGHERKVTIQSAADEDASKEKCQRSTDPDYRCMAYVPFTFLSGLCFLDLHSFLDSGRLHSSLVNSG